MNIKLEIEKVFNVISRGQFVVAKRIDPKTNFYITKKSFLGGVELMEFLDIPRYIDENGNQRDIVALQLKYSQDAIKLPNGLIVELEPVDSIIYLKPWLQIIAHNESFEDALQKEISPKHFLYKRKLSIIGRRSDNDEILVEIEDCEYQFAIVHLTYGQHIDANTGYLGTELFKNWLELYNNKIVPDHERYSSFEMGTGSNNLKTKTIIIICKHMSSIFKIASMITCLVMLSSFVFVDKVSSEYSKLQQLEQLALKSPVGKEFIVDLTGKRGCNETRVKYLGIARTCKGRRYKILTSFFVFSTSADMCHGTSNIKIYDMKNRFVGEYYVGMPEGLPDTLLNNKLLYLDNSGDCSLRKERLIDLSNGLPKSFYIRCTNNGGDIYSFSSGN
ncbi:MAG: hypothetical protein QM731_08545 [Chitinophagaceae bacterium]